MLLQVCVLHEVQTLQAIGRVLLFQPGKFKTLIFLYACYIPPCHMLAKMRNFDWLGYIFRGKFFLNSLSIEGKILSIDADLPSREIARCYTAKCNTNAALRSFTFQRKAYSGTLSRLKSPKVAQSYGDLRSQSRPSVTLCKRVNLRQVYATT